MCMFPVPSVFVLVTLTAVGGTASAQRLESDDGLCCHGIDLMARPWVEESWLTAWWLTVCQEHKKGKEGRSKEEKSAKIQC